MGGSSKKLIFYPLYQIGDVLPLFKNCAYHGFALKVPFAPKETQKQDIGCAYYLFLQLRIFLLVVTPLPNLLIFPTHISPHHAI